jgi:hypothetical protein
MEKSGSEIRDKHPGSYFLKPSNNFLRLKIITFLSIHCCCAFWTSASGSGMEKSGSEIRDKHPGSYFRKPNNGFLVKNTYIFCQLIVGNPDPGLFLTLNPGWENLDPGAGINIPDPQHCQKQKIKLREGDFGVKINFFLNIEGFIWGRNISYTYAQSNFN